MFLINNTYLVFRFYLLWQPHFYLFSLNFYLFSLFSLLVYLSSFILTLCFLFCCVLPLFVWVSYFLSDLLLLPTPQPNLTILLFQFRFCCVVFFLPYHPWSGKQGLNLPLCIGSMDLNHRTARKVPIVSLLWSLWQLEYVL